MCLHRINPVCNCCYSHLVTEGALYVTTQSPPLRWLIVNCAIIEGLSSLFARPAFAKRQCVRVSWITTSRRSGVTVFVCDHLDQRKHASHLIGSCGRQRHGHLRHGRLRRATVQRSPSAWMRPIPNEDKWCSQDWKKSHVFFWKIKKSRCFKFKSFFYDSRRRWPPLTHVFCNFK